MVVGVGWVAVVVVVCGGMMGGSGWWVVGPSSQLPRETLTAPTSTTSRTTAAGRRTAPDMLSVEHRGQALLARTHGTLTLLRRLRHLRRLLQTRHPPARDRGSEKQPELRVDDSSPIRLAL